mgnify:CR=1 FL=1
METTIIIDDHPLFRGGLRAALEAAGGFGACAEAGSVAEGAKAIEEAPQGERLAIVDLNLPDGSGFELVERYGGERGFRCLMLSMHDDRSMALKAIRLGANGYASKQIALDALIAGLRLVALDQIFIEAELLRDIVTPLCAAAELEHAARARLEALSPREREAFKLLADGRSSKEIAMAMGVGQRSAENYLSALYAKLGRSSEAGLVRLAMQAGISSPWSDGS